ncbi:MULTISPECIES: hypothetical protein [unclassified Rhodococcus (in: high G+C Gram-positive bacteria)]|uniref:hypothetical protein n=1 Tax=unclassified Rhodococcus (in: high G+C Gram-positive bacteria) TaxID=192944 RepID=UPI00339146A1
MSDGDEVTLFELLGVSRDSLLEPPPQSIWEDAIAYAVDPDSPDAEDGLVPHDGGAGSEFVEFVDDDDNDFYLSHLVGDSDATTLEKDPADDVPEVAVDDSTDF